MTQPVLTIDYSFLIFPHLGPSEESVLHHKKSSGWDEHKPYVRGVKPHISARKAIGEDSRGLIQLLYWMPEKKRVPHVRFMEDAFDSPNSLERLFRKEAKQGVKDRKRKRALKRFLTQEKKSRRVVYSEHMSSDKWKFFRDQIINERGDMCERCGKIGNGPLNIHHLTYARLGHELPEDVKVYCLPCHKLMHPGWE